MVLKVLLAASLLAFGGLFSGCSLEQKAADFIEAKFKAMVPILEEKAAAAAETALKKKAEARLVELDAQLAKIVLKDADGNPTVKTWKDFSADHGASGHLLPGESAAAGAFLAREISKQVAQGEITKEEGGKRLKDTGVTVGALALIGLAFKALKMVGGKPSTTPGSTPAV
jgi:hypothetical protein